jgi:hypothetical protein
VLPRGARPGNDTSARRFAKQAGCSEAARIMTTAAGYNERLFSGGLRRFVHQARFSWLEQAVARHAPAAKSFVELGCFDGRAVGSLPSGLTRYVGYDANWEGGLDLALANFAGKPQFDFRKVEQPKDLNRSERFDAGICLETFEHLPVDQLGTFIDWMAEVVTGTVFVSIPNEKHGAFLGKYLYHRLITGGQQYSPLDVAGSLLGKMNWVERNDHKGFDYQDVINRVSRHFRVVEVQGLPMGRLPKMVSPTISFVATR